MSDYDSRGRLTRAAAERIIRGGGSVSIGKNIYSAVDRLPSDAEFAKGDKAAEDAARERLRAQRADLDKQLAALESPAPDPVKTVDPGHKAKVA